MLVQRVLLPATRRESWTVLGDDGPVQPIERYLAYLTDIERSPNTVRAYAHDLKDWFVFLAGQVPLDERGEIVGRGDPIEQTRRCLTNLEQALAAVGATPGDAVRTTVYVVASDQRHMGDVWRAVLDSEVGDVARTAATLVGVERLGYEGQLVEIDVTLAVPRR